MLGFGPVGVGLLLVVVFVVAIAVGVVSVVLGLRMIPRPVSSNHNSTLSPFLTCVSLVYGALLGFTIVVAWEQFSSADTNVAAEASTVTTMYRQTVAMPPQPQAKMRELLRNYTNAVAGPEWNRQDAGGTSDTARGAITEMYRIIGSHRARRRSEPGHWGISRPVDGPNLAAKPAHPRRRTPHPRVVVDGAALWRCLDRRDQRLLVSGEHAGSPRADLLGRRLARLAVIHRLHARSPFRQPRCHIGPL